MFLARARATHTLALSNSIPVANSLADADARWQSKGLLLNTKGVGEEKACQRLGKMQRGAGESSDRAALSQGGFSTPILGGIFKFSLKAVLAVSVGVHLPRAGLACRDTGTASA